MTASPRWSERVEVPYHLGHVYTECARIWNPIHTDLAVARAAGLPGPILHGTAKELQSELMAQLESLLSASTARAPGEATTRPK